MDFLERIARRTAPASHDWSVRGVVEQSERLVVRQDVAEAPWRQTDGGAMVSVASDGAIGYAATGDLTEAGMRRAFGQALALARASGRRSVVDHREIDLPAGAGSYRSPNERPVAQLSLGDRFDLLRQVCASANLGPAIVDRGASLWTTHTEQLLITAGGGRIEQSWDFVVPAIVVVASMAPASLPGISTCPMRFPRGLNTITFPPPKHAT